MSRSSSSDTASRRFSLLKSRAASTSRCRVTSSMASSRGGVASDVLVAEAVLVGEVRGLLARVGAGDLLALAFLAKRLSRGRGAVHRCGDRLVGGTQVGALEQRVLGEVALQLLVQLNGRQL